MGIPYALTGFSGAERFAPAVRYQRATIYISRDIRELAQRLEFKLVPSGANITLLSPYDNGVFHGSQEIDGIRIASPVQLYLDLIHAHGRGEEAAAALRERILQI
jgi:hypothetical protein